MWIAGTGCSLFVLCTHMSSCYLFSPNTIGCSLLNPCTFWKYSSRFTCLLLSPHPLTLCSLLPVFVALSSFLAFMFTSPSSVYCYILIPSSFLCLLLSPHSLHLCSLLLPVLVAFSTFLVLPEIYAL